MAAPVARAVAASLARLDADGADSNGASPDGVDSGDPDPAAGLSGADARALGTELRRLAADLRAEDSTDATADGPTDRWADGSAGATEDTANGPTDEPIEEPTDRSNGDPVDGATDVGRSLSPADASRAVYAVVDRRGPDVCRAAPDAVWTVVDAVRTRLDDDGPVGVYARATREALPVSDRAGGRGLSTNDVAEALGDDDHRRAAAVVAARGLVDDDLAPALAGALAADQPTRRWAAKAIDYAYRPVADPHASRLLALTDDRDPATRAAAVGGLCGRLWLDYDDPPDWGTDALAALADALVDPAPVVRIRAAGVLDVYTDALVESRLWSDCPPAVRGRLAVGAVRTDLSESATDKPHWSFPSTIVGAVDPADVWTVQSELVEAGWPTDGDRSPGDAPLWEAPGRLARRAVASAAAADPGGLDDPAEVVDRVAARESGLDHAEARLLRTLFDRVPAAVVEAVPALAATLDPEEPADASREAARTLGAIARDRPGAVPVDRERLVEAVGPVDRRGYLQEERLAALATVDPERARTALREACRRAEDYGSVGAAVGLAGQADPSVVAGAADAVVAALEAIDARDLDRALAGLAAAAEADPDAVRPHADRLVPALGHHRTPVRAAAARAIATVGEARPGAVPAVATPLVDAPGPEESDRRAEDPAWPLGTVAAADPAAAVELARDGLPADPLGRHAHVRHLSALVAEVAAGDPGAGATIAADLVDREFGDRESRRLCRVLRGTAEAGADGAVRRALTGVYDDPGAFPAAVSDRERAETVLSLVGLDPDG